MLASASYLPSGLRLRKSTGTCRRRNTCKGRYVATVRADVGVRQKVGAALGLGVLNRVCQKLCLSSELSSHVLVVSLFLSVCYTLVYSATLALNVQRGNVPLSDLRSVPLALLLVTGFGEALGSVLGTFGAANLGTSSAAASLLPLLSQSLLIWQLMWSSLLLRTQFTANNYVGVLLIALGIAIVTMSSSDASMAGVISSTSSTALIACIVSTCPPALAATVKQKAFATMRDRLGGRDASLFLVNTFGSIVQVLATITFLPLTALSRGVPVSELPSAFSSGFAVLFGAVGPYEPLLALLYGTVNLIFNVSALLLLRSTSAAIASVSLSLTVPLSAAAFSFLPLPYLSKRSLGTSFLLGSVVVLSGVAIYNDLIRAPPGWRNLMPFPGKGKAKKDE